MNNFSATKMLQYTRSQGGNSHHASEQTLGHDLPCTHMPLKYTAILVFFLNS